MVEVMSYAGLRIGEVLLVQREDVDVVKRRIAVTRSWTTEGTRWVQGSAKTGKGRVAPVSASLAAYLDVHVASVEPGGYLFCGPRGIAPWQPDNWRSRVWKRAIAGTDFEAMGITPHDLRHTAAPMAIAAGAEVVAVQSMLGHASATEMLNAYSHLWPNRLGAITDAVEAARKAALWLAT
jgi:integrase